MAGLLATPAPANAQVLIDGGTSCVSIAPGSVPGAIPGQRNGLGYRYSYFGIFGLDLWTWDGAYCVYSNTHYKTVSDDDAVRVAKEFGFVLRPPFSYRVPSGLLVIAVIGVLGLPVAWLRRRMLARDTPPPSIL
jgi:hypothetical protein